MQLNSPLKQSLARCLEQIQFTLEAINECSSSDMIYNDSGIGKHIRHVHDHFLAVIAGAQTGTIDYNLRNRNSLAEKCLIAALDQLSTIKHWFHRDEILIPKNVSVISEISAEISCSCSFNSTWDREILYLLNHTTHHLAYIKLMLLQYYIELPPHIGLAPSTASHLRSKS